MKSISEQLHKVIDEFEEIINRDDRFPIFIFKFKEKKFRRFEKSLSINADEMKVDVTK